MSSNPDIEIRRAQNRKAMVKYNLKKRYGITLEEKLKLFEEANHSCVACGNKEFLRIDHDHSTGKVRGILCNGCNTALGHLDESVTRIAKLLLYIERIK